MVDGVELMALGSRDEAERLVRRAETSVTAYGTFLSQCGWLGGDFASRPCTDKSTYLLAHPYADLLGDDYENAFTIFASSGSSGRPFYWPQLRDGQEDVLPRLRGFLEQSFAIDTCRTLAVVGLALGSWIGGEHISWALKSLAVQVPYAFSVFSPGNQHDEIITMIHNAAPFVDQVVLFLCPSAIGHLRLRAESEGRPLPLDRMRFVVLGEPFPENLRTSLQDEAGLPRTAPAMLSIYGSADTGTLGIESPASVAMRRILCEAPDVAETLGWIGGIPHLFHCAAPDAYLEVEHGELIVTRWQGIPLLRYNLHDEVRFISWSDLRAAVLGGVAGRDELADLVSVVSAADARPDLLAIRGRADSALILCGTNITETMLDEAVRCPELEETLTGMYLARIGYEAGRQRLVLELEVRAECRPDPATVDRVYDRLVAALGRVQPEFKHDWEAIYCTWDDDRSRRILDLHCVSWPALSERIEGRIKHRGTVS